jgi:glyoxylase-like metal-dependent hydrolase (beta-lactamase superfamily II)
VNSHLHFDHCGNNPLFPGVPIYTQAIELAAAREPWYTVPDWIDFAGAEYRTSDGEAKVADGIRIVATPGHTTGHQSLVLDGATGTVVLAGQAIYSRAEYETIVRTGAPPDDDPPPDPAPYLASAMSLIELRPRRVHFSHDREVWHAP